ncbi:hypothetical protein VTO42DRAFT_5013 [Malbranchea cinnamomea]
MKDESTYEQFRMLNREFTIIDDSDLPCGLMAPPILLPWTLMVESPDKLVIKPVPSMALVTVTVSLRLSHLMYRDGPCVLEFLAAKLIGMIDMVAPETLMDVVAIHSTRTELILGLRSKRFYVQKGKVSGNSVSTTAEVSGNSIAGEYCNSQKDVFNDIDVFNPHKGLAYMGDALAQGVVLGLRL